jgi:putative transposase
MVRSRASLHLEIIALRHQLGVVNRSRHPRLRLTSADRALWAWLSQAWSGGCSAVHIIRPDTVIAWHRRGLRLFWTWKSRYRLGRPRVSHDIRVLICEMSTANPLWGAPRIHGEPQKLGLSVSQSIVAKYMHRPPRPLSQTWRTFLTNHAIQIMAVDLFVVPTVTFRMLFVLVILAHERRRIVHVAVTEHPTSFFDILAAGAGSQQRENQLSSTFAACFQQSPWFRRTVVDTVRGACRIEKPVGGAAWTCAEQVTPPNGGRDRIDLRLSRSGTAASRLRTFHL